MRFRPVVQIAVSLVVLSCVGVGQNAGSNGSGAAITSSMSAASSTTEAPATVASPAGIDVSALLIEALGSYRSGHFEDAIAKYQSIIAQNPKSGDAYAGLSRCLLKQQKIS